LNSLSTGRSPWLRRGCLMGIALLYVASVPWYREAGAAPALLFGLPDWVAISVGCYVAVAILNSVAWLNTDVPDHLDEASSPAPRDSEAN